MAPGLFEVRVNIKKLEKSSANAVILTECFKHDGCIVESMKLQKVLCSWCVVKWQTCPPAYVKIWL